MEERRRPRDDTSVGEYIAKGAMDVERDILERAIDTHAGKIAPGTRAVAKAVHAAPGFIFDIAQFATAKNKPRALAEVVGGVIGTTIGAAGGMGVASPLTGAIGGAAGSWAGGELYDAGEEMADDFYDRHRARIDAARRWIDERSRDVYARRNDPPLL